MNILTEKDLLRFWGKVDKEKSETFYNGTRCWEWIAGLTSTGYGQITIQRKKCKPHRVTYALAFGEILNGLHVLHHCDNPVCVRPDHLFLGTQKDNMEDKVRKMRQSAGENHYNCTVSGKQVEEIRRRYGFRGIGGESGRELAKEFDVYPQVISDIVRKKTHKNLSGTN